MQTHSYFDSFEQILLFAPADYMLSYFDDVNNNQKSGMVETRGNRALH